MNGIFNIHIASHERVSLARRAMALICAVLMLAAALSACSSRAAINGVILNDLSGATAEEKAALCSHLKAQYGDKASEASIISRVEYSGGALLLSKLIGEEPLAAELYYINKGLVTAATSDSATDYINYTRMFGNLIVYGDSFARDGENNYLDTTSVEALFTNGETAKADMLSSAKAPCGYIIVGNGATWLKKLSVYKGEELLADDACALFAHESTAYQAEPVSIRNRTKFSYMAAVSDKNERAELIKKSNVRAGEYTTVLETWPEEYTKAFKLAFADMWRSANSLDNAIKAKPGELLKIAGIDYSDVMGIYWVDLSEDDGTGNGSYDSQAQERASWLHIGLDLKDPQKAPEAWSAPKKEGCHMVIFRTEKASYSAVVEVAL